MRVPDPPYSVKATQVGLVLGMTRTNYHIMYEDQPIMTLFAPNIAKTVCDAMNRAYQAGYFDRLRDDAIRR